jgi:UDP-2,3-diacylglucosamine hydrolase
MADWVFIADAHLREWDLDGQARVNRFLSREKKNLETLVILGDLFEFWFDFGSSAFEGYRPIFDKLEELAQAGIQIVYVEGNHEFGLGSYFRNTLKAKIYPRCSVARLEGKRIYMAHGDLINRKDMFYRIFRFLLKNPLTYCAARTAGPVRTKKVASFLSGISRGRGYRGRVKEIEPRFQQFAIEKAREGFDIVILAHNHLPNSCLLEVDGKEAHYFNVGDWIDHYSYLRYHPGQGFGIEYFR